MKTPQNKTGIEPEPRSGSLDAVVSPQPGEVWKHYRHGLVKIIGAWNERESVCETLDGKRHLLMNELLAKTEAFWVEG